MRSESKNLALLKSLAAIAWADRELSNEELNYLKHLALKFNLSNDGWVKLEPYLDDPISLEEGEELIKNFLVQIKTQKEKQELLSALEDMIRADNKVTRQEQEFLERFSQIINSTSTLSIIRDKLKGLLGKTLFSPSPARDEELSDYSNNKLMQRVCRRFKDAGIELKLPDGQLNFLTLYGGLMAWVAYAGGEISLHEKKTIKSRLNELSGFCPDEVDIIVAVIEDQALKGLDRFRLTSEFFKVSNQEQRLQLLDCLFGLAGADDHQPSHQEVEEIRSIAYALYLSHKDFIAAKLKCLHKNNTV